MEGTIVVLLSMRQGEFKPLLAYGSDCTQMIMSLVQHHNQWNNGETHLPNRGVPGRVQVGEGHGTKWVKQYFRQCVRQ